MKLEDFLFDLKKLNPPEFDPGDRSILERYEYQGEGIEGEWGIIVLPRGMRFTTKKEAIEAFRESIKKVNRIKSLEEAVEKCINIEESTRFSADFNIDIEGKIWWVPEVYISKNKVLCVAGQGLATYSVKVRLTSFKKVNCEVKK